MGLDTTAIKFICAARSSGVDFAETVTIGRQNFIPTPKVLNRVFSAAGVKANAKNFISEHRFADEFFACMGAQTVHSLDYSSYEDATIIQDMNSPIPENLRGNYSVVYDGGTIEHVFNMPQALKNCMEMVKVGGHFMQANVANNFMGHGFWQFSPELLFRVLSKENGFQVETILLHEVLPDAGWTCRNDAWYAVADPDEVRERCELCNKFPTYILTIAKKIADVEIFATPPQQSDYATIWKEHSGVGGNSSGEHQGWKTTLKQKMRETTPTWLKKLLHHGVRFRQRLRGSFNRPYYTKIREEDLLQGKIN